MPSNFPHQLNVCNITVIIIRERAWNKVRHKTYIKFNDTENFGFGWMSMWHSVRHLWPYSTNKLELNLKKSHTWVMQWNFRLRIFKS